MFQDKLFRRQHASAMTIMALAFIALSLYFSLLLHLPSLVWESAPPSALRSPPAGALKGPDGNLYPAAYVPQIANRAPRANAAFVVIVRNNELKSMKSSMRHVEDRFNRKYGYPWIFLNDEHFTDTFMEEVQKMTRSKVQFGVIPTEHWSYPSWIDQGKAAQCRKKMADAKVVYGGSESYRHMCRWNSGFFYKHPLVLPYDFYWRVEPGIQLFCDIDYDPFVFMEMNKKSYGFTIALHENADTVPTLYETTRQFIAERPSFVHENSSLHFLTDRPDQFSKPGNPGWNGCHFWSNFEIADLRFWRSQAYQEYFDFLDRAGGFFYERWGDAPVHSLAASLFLDKARLHHFDDIGYQHGVFSHCPRQAGYHQGRCDCRVSESIDLRSNSCLKQWWPGSAEKEPTYVVPPLLEIQG